MFYSRVDTQKVKKMIQGSRDMDTFIIQAKLENLAEFDRTISSKGSCHRQSVLLLLDEQSDRRCSGIDALCNNCSKPIPFVPHDITNHARLVIEFLLSHGAIDLFSLRQILSGLYHCHKGSHVGTIEGLLKSWPLSEVAQFTDSLFSHGLMFREGVIFENKPFSKLSPTTKGKAFLILTHRQ